MVRFSDASAGPLSFPTWKYNAMLNTSLAANGSGQDRIADAEHHAGTEGVELVKPIDNFPFEVGGKVALFSLCLLVQLLH